MRVQILGCLPYICVIREEILLERPFLSPDGIMVFLSSLIRLLF
jgi:hypothetical protein